MRFLSFFSMNKIYKTVSALTAMLMIFALSSCAGSKKSKVQDIQDDEHIYLVTDDTPNCSMIISDEVFNEIKTNDDFSYILDMMNDYFNVVINSEIDPNIVYVKPVTTKIDSEVRLAEVYDAPSKVSVIIQLAEAGLEMIESEIDESTSDHSGVSGQEDETKEIPSDKKELLDNLVSSIKVVANKGAIYSVKSIKDDFKRKTAEIYGANTGISGSLKYSDYVINTDAEKGISISCGSLESVIDALSYFLTEYVQMGTSNEGNYLIDVPDSAKHVGHYLDVKIAGIPLVDYSIIYYCDKTYYDSRENAKYLKQYFLKNCGIDVFTKDYNPFQEIKNKILIGKLELDLSNEYYSQKNIDIMDYRIVQQDGDLYIMGGSDWAIRYAINYLIDEFFSKEIPVPAGYFHEGNFYGEQLYFNYEGSELRIMSNNVWDCTYNSDKWYSFGENSFNIYRFPKMAKVYLAYKPDILCFQEMNMRTLYSNTMLNEINACGGNYLYVDKFSSGYDVGCNERNCTPIAYNSDTLTLIASGDQQYPKHGNNLRTKSYTWGYFEKKGTDFRFLVFSTHLWWKRDIVYKGSSDLRIEQMTLLNEKADELIAEYDCPCFIMGDFNCNTTSREFAAFLNLGFEDCHSKAEKYSNNESGRYACSNSTFSYKHSVGTYKKNSIDHILVKNLKKANVLSYDYAMPNFYGKLSDHAPVFIDIKIRRNDA